MVTMVCADALQLPNIKGDYDIVSIVSYNKEPKHFESFIDTQVKNNKVVIYCNDGRFGGSSINLPLDKRPISWLFEAPLNGKAPKGDALLVVDVPTGQLATQVGVFNPINQYEVKLLASITYNESAEEDQDVSKELFEIVALPNNQARNSRIASILQKRKHNPNQKPRLEYLLDLSRKGVDSGKIWSAYGHDLVLDLKGLADLEARFSQICSEKLVHQFVDGDLEPQSVASLQGFLRDCKLRNPTPEKAGSITTSSKPSKTKDAYINREDQVTTMLNALDSGAGNLLEVRGLPQIGKSAVIDLALSRTAFQRIKRVQLLNTSSAGYIIAEWSGKSKTAVDFTAIDLKSRPELEEIVKEWDVLWLENCQHLLESDRWKSTEIETLINGIVSVVLEGRVKTKVIFETSRSLPFELRDPSAITKFRISGFEQKLVKHGVAIFDRQLRRLDFNPNDVLMETKEQFVRDLGGHPMAIIFCADAICEEGPSAVKGAIRQGTGFVKEVIDRVLEMVTLSAQDENLLRIVSGCRIEAPRDAISATCNFPATEHISNLSRLCLVDIVSPSTIRLPGVLRNKFRFTDLDLETRKILHKNATMMYTQMARDFPRRVEFAVEVEYHAMAIDQVAKVATGLIDGRLSAAKKFYDEHNFSKASEALNPLMNPLMTGSPSDEVIRLSALIDAQLGDLRPALAKGEKVLAKNPSDIHFFSALGKAVLTQSRPELGDTLVAISRKAGVAETRVSILEGRLALRRRDFQKAEICFRHALRSPGTDPWAYFYLGTTYLRIGELHEAIDILYEGDEYVANNPRIRGSARNAIRVKLGVAYVLNGDLQAASTILENLKEEEPDNPEMLYAYWLLTVRKDGVERAEEAFEVFRNAKPKRWEWGLYHLYYGLFLKALERLDEAKEHFELAYKNEPYNVYIMIQYAENLYSLALKAWKEPDIELAKDRALKCARIVRRIFEFDSDNPSAENLQVDLYNEFGIEISGLEGEK